MSSRRQRPIEPTSDQTLRWIEQTFVGRKKTLATRELRRIEAQHGRLIPRLIVDEARSPRSPLHVFFEWDDSVAAEKYRISQATALIRTVKVSIQAPDLSVRQVRAFVAPIPGQGYMAIGRVLSDRDLRKQLIAQALRDLELFKQKYETLVEVAEIVSELEGSLRRAAKKTKAA